MAKDKTNIFKLSREEQNEYKKDPFFDCFPGTEDFAKSLEQDILTKETPYVLLLEKNYGMGKTFFSTRFAQYLRNNKLSAVYFSAWENDYLPDPFLSFSKELIKYFEIEFPVKTTAKKTIEFPIEALITLAKSISINFASVGVPVSFNVNNIFEQLKQAIDPVQDFKQKFSKFIKKLKKKKLVLIVDELDRCRPDYAMKVLEIIKHFFDIEGLFVIVPTNQSALETSLEALYGIKSKEARQNPDCENYFNKFFNYTSKIPEPNYTKIVKDYVKLENLSKAVEKGYIIETSDKFNSFDILIQSLSNYGCAAKLSLRQMTRICSETIHICNHFNEEEIRCEYLAYLICNEEKKKKKNPNGTPSEIPLNSDHPYFTQGNNSKIRLLDLNIYKNSIFNLQRIGNMPYTSFNDYRNDFERTFQNQNSFAFQSYSEINDFINEHKDKINNITIPDGYHEHMQGVAQNKIKLMDILTKKEHEIKYYQKRYGSDDNDDSRRARYKEIIEKSETLYKALETLKNN